MGAGRILSAAVCFSDAHYLGPECRLSVPRLFWHDPLRWNCCHDILAGFYQYWNGDGFDAGGGRSVAVYQLRWFVHGSHDDLYGPFNERQYETFYARIVNFQFLQGAV